MDRIIYIFHNQIFDKYNAIIRNIFFIVTTLYIFNLIHSVEIPSNSPLNTPVGDICDSKLLILTESTLIEDAIIAISKSQCKRIIVKNANDEKYTKILSPKDISFNFLCDCVIDNKMTV